VRFKSLSALGSFLYRQYEAMELTWFWNRAWVTI